MIKYNKDNADILLEDFVDLTSMDLGSQSRKPDDVYIRSMFFKILKDLNKMSEGNIEKYLNELGYVKDRTSIRASILRIDSYYLNYIEFREIYDVYFGDKKKAYLKKQKRKERNNALREAATRLSDNDYEELQNFRTKEAIQKDALDKVLYGVPIDRRKEIYDMVNLRIKSWSWKSKNEYEIIECSGGLSGQAY